MIFVDRGFRQYCDVLGREGAPVICMVHSLNADSDMWADQVPALLAADYRIVRVDLRGHGASTAGEEPFTIEMLSEDVLAVLDALKIEKAHILGLSIGGMIGQSIGIRHPERVETLVLCDTLPCGPADREAYRARIAAVRDANSLDSAIAHGMARRFTEAFQQKRPGRWREMLGSYVGTTIEGYVGGMTALMDFDFRDALPHVTLPALILFGAGDLSTSPAIGRAMAAMMPNAVYHEIDEARHLPNVEQPAAFNTLLLDWLGQHRAKA